MTGRPHDLRIQIENALADLIHDWPDLEHVSPTGGAVTGGADEPRLPGGTTRMHLIADATTLLSAYVLLVLEERDLTGASIGAEPPDRADFLLTHAEWLAGHDVAEDAATELSDMARAVRSHVAPSGVRRVPIGACPVLDCGGAVFAVVSDSGDGTGPDCTCDLDRDHVWPEGAYHRLAAMLGTDGPARMTPPDLSAWLREHFHRDVPSKTIRTWVHRFPITVGWDAATGTVDRVATTSHWLERRARRAGAA